MPNLYSLLIGITDYPAPFSLNGCIRDVEKIRDYIDGLDQSYYDNIVEPIVLLNQQGNKENIATTLSNVLGELNDDDTLLFYFSGHGAEEIAPGRFIDDHNGLLQGIVCYYAENDDSNHLLADKELRYLFNKSKTKAHVLSIFDCCHSGDITRAIDKEKSIRRLSSKYPSRPYQNFLFAKELDEAAFKTKPFNDIFPDVNQVTLSACASNEFSWEKSDGGFFTNALIRGLELNNNAINYGDITRECRLLIQQKTLERQSPTIDVLGDKELNQLTSWLRLNGDRLLESRGYIKSYGNGWIYSQGSLSGVEPDDTLSINKSELNEKEIKICEVLLAESKIEDPYGLDMQLDPDKKYAVIRNSKTLKLKIAVDNLDGDLKTEKIILEELTHDKDIIFSTQYFDCEFQINIFNETIYLSRTGDPFRPLNRQQDLLSVEIEEDQMDRRIRDYLDENLKILAKWDTIKNLKIGEGFNDTPIRVEINYGTDEWIDITNGHISFDPSSRVNTNDSLFRDYDIRVINISNEDLYVTVLSLYNSKLEISIHAFDETTILLEKGKTKKFKPSRIVLDHYQEIYNWEYEVVEHKFIVNNYQSLNAEIGTMTQDGFFEPITHFGTLAGGGRAESYDSNNRSGIYSSTLRLNNNTFNQITGTLLSNFDWYQDSEIVQPFIESLYYDVDTDLFDYQLANKPSSNEEAFRGSIKMNIGNFIDYTRRNRKFKKMRRQYPDKKVIVAEGDSWFLYPILVKDTIDYIMESWPVKNLAWAGDTLANYKKSGQLLKTVKKLNPRPKYVLLSGGGNDIIGAEIKGLLIKNAQNVQSPRDYLNDKYDMQMQTLKDYYIYFFEALNKMEWIEKILVHGYDYIRPDHARIVVKGGWLNKYLEEFGITNAVEREKLIVFLIDEFNHALKNIAGGYTKVTYLDLRGLIERDEWFDEIHPDDNGYKKVADKFLAEIN